MNYLSSCIGDSGGQNAALTLGIFLSRGRGEGLNAMHERNITATFSEAANYVSVSYPVKFGSICGTTAHAGPRLVLWM